MIDFAARFDDLFDLLRNEHGLAEDERPGLEVLCAASVIPRVLSPSPWLVLETDWLSRTTRDAWFSLGGELVPHALGVLQAMRTRTAVYTLDEWIAEECGSGRPLVFVEPEWRRPRVWTAVRSGSQFRLGQRLYETLRVRVKSPRTLSVLSATTAAEARRARLRHAAREVLRSDFRVDNLPAVNESELPRDFAYWCELTMKLARQGTDWSWLTNAVLAIARRRAYLFGREKVNPQDWELAGKMLSWQAPVWTAGMLRKFIGKTRGIFPGALRKQTWIDAVGQEAAQAGRVVVRREFERLRSCGVIQKVEGGVYWSEYRLAEQDQPLIERLLDGRAFSA